MQGSEETSLIHKILITNLIFNRRIKNKQNRIIIQKIKINKTCHVVTSLLSHVQYLINSTNFVQQNWQKRSSR